LKDYIYIYLFLGLFLISQIVTYFAYSLSISKYERLKQSLLIQYNLPKTSFQLNSIKKSLQKEFKEQKIIKDALLKLDKIDLKSDEKYMDIVVSKDSLSLHIKTTKQRSKSLIESFKRRFSVTSASFNDGILTLEVSL